LDAGGASQDRVRSIGPDDDRGVDVALARRAIDGEPVACPGSRGEIDPTHPRPAPDLRPGRRPQVEQRVIEPPPVEANGRRRQRAVVPVGQAEGGAARRLDTHCRRWPRRGLEDRPGHADVAKSRHRDRAGEDAAGAPAPARRPLEHDHLATPAREERRDDRAGRTAADDRDLDAAGSAHPRTAAIAQRSNSG
jgi:hypothetical protein